MVLSDMIRIHLKENSAIIDSTSNIYDNTATNTVTNTHITHICSSTRTNNIQATYSRQANKFHFINNKDAVAMDMDKSSSSMILLKNMKVIIICLKTMARRSVIQYLCELN